MILVAVEAIAEDTFRLILQLDEPGTIWCQAFDQYSTTATTLLETDVTSSNFVSYIQGGSARSTEFKAVVGSGYTNSVIEVFRSSISFDLFHKPKDICSYF